jgi:hypothetical protein
LGAPSVALGQTLGAPAFEEFPLDASWNGTNPKVILDTDFARSYRTRLRSIGTGEIPFTICCHDGEGMNGGRAEYYPDSSLIIFRALLNEENPKREAYYRMAEGALVLLGEHPLVDDESADESTGNLNELLSSSKTFGGYTCRADCTGHEAG